MINLVSSSQAQIDILQLHKSQDHNLSVVVPGVRVVASGRSAVIKMH